MNVLTPLVLSFVPWWAGTLWMKAVSQPSLAPQEAAPEAQPDDAQERDPAHWAVMPFTPPALHRTSVHGA